MVGDDDDVPDVYIPGGEAPQTHPASSGGPYEIPDVSGEAADIADEIEFNYAQAEFDMEKH